MKYPKSKSGLSRRDALKAGAAFGALSLSSGARAFAARPVPGTQRDVVVVVFLRGGADGLSIVVPTGDDRLYAERPTLGIREADTLPLNRLFGLSRIAAPLYPLFQSGELALMHAVGSLNPTRSHFEAMRRIEQAAIVGGTLPEGWLARHLQTTLPANPGANGRAIAIDRTLPASLQGSVDAIPITSLKDFELGGPMPTRSMRAARLAAMLEAAPAPDGPIGGTTLELLNTLDSIDFETRPVASGVNYPEGEFGRALYETATLIREDVGIEAIEVDSHKWDHHGDARPLTGRLATRLTDLSQGLAAFMEDLGPAKDRVTVMVMSEFGRRIDQNGSLGFDHGRGGIAMVLGGAHVKGNAKVHGTWPGLGVRQQDDKALAVTTDIRDIIGEILVKRMGTTDLATVLPGYTPNFHGLVTA